MSDAYPEVAAVEDCNSDDGEAVPETRRTANVTVKRKSQSSVVSKTNRQQRSGPPDAASDSGYSSHTNVTTNSGASVPERRFVIPAPRVETAPSPTKKRTPLVHVRKESNSQQSPGKGPTRSSSTSRRPVQKEFVDDCTDPRCDCQRPRKERRPPPVPLDNSIGIDHAPSTQPERSPKYRSQPSPQYRQPPYGYSSETVPTVRLPQPRPRAPSAIRARPQSYHAGATRAETYWGQIPNTAYAIPPMPVSRGPPPSVSAYSHQPNPVQQPYPYLGATPPQASFLPSPLSPAQTSPTSPFHPSQPSLPRAAPEAYTISARRPHSIIGPPVISYDSARPRIPYAATSHPSARHPSTRQPVPGSFVDSSSSSSSSSDSDCRRSPSPPPYRVLMPPSRMTPSRRPSLKQSSYSSDVLITRGSREPRDNRPSRETPRSDSEFYRLPLDNDRFDSDRTIRIRDRRTSSSRRPSLTNTDSSGRTKATSYSNSSGSAKIITIESNGGRRLSYYGHEKRSELERMKREVEAYQDAVRGDTLPNVMAEDLRRQKRLSISGPSNISAGSQRSQRSRRSTSSKDEGSRLSKTLEGIRIRLDGKDGGTTIEFSGDMDGRTIQVRPQEEGGGAEFVIGGPSGRDKRYSEGTMRSGRVSRSRTISEVRGRRDSRVRRVVEEEGEYERAL
ncbi:hypothetical protein LTR66_010328 [Elasticomyces elasticus]|nr:hypothetical protein LTR66_010328 [Elasticomyces elasticus]